MTDTWRRSFIRAIGLMPSISPLSRHLAQQDREAEEVRKRYTVRVSDYRDCGPMPPLRLPDRGDKG